MLHYAFALFLNICTVDKNTFQKSDIQPNITVGVGTALSVFRNPLCANVVFFKSTHFGKFGVSNRL